MRARLTLLAPLSLVSLLPLLQCSSSSSSPPPGAADSGAATLTYAPAGCAYSVTPPASRGFVDLALDDATAPSDAAGAAPQRVRVGLGGLTAKGKPGYADPTTTAAFTWETAVHTTNAKVRLGTDPSALGDVHTGYVFTAPPPTTGIGESEPPTFFHEAHVCGLKPATTYYYQVGGGAPGAEIWSATQSFTTSPASGDVTVGVFGDSRSQVNVWQLVHERMREAAPSLLLVSGDVVDFGTSASLWQQWLDATWKDPSDATKWLTLGQVPWITVAGNHEGESAQYFGAFALPGDGDNAEQYGSFDLGNAHFVLLDDTPMALDPTSDASKAILAWLDADLTAADADRAAHPFVVAMHHRGVASTGEHAKDPDVLAVRGALVPLFDKHHVDLVVNGHDHEYERSQPVNAASDPTAAPVVVAGGAKGTTYVVNGGAGADARPINTNPAAYQKTATQYGAGTKYVGCYSLLKMSGGTLTMTVYGLKASGGSIAGDDVIDTLTLGQGQ